MALEGQTDLYDTPAQQDHTNGTNQRKDKRGKVVHHSERIAASCKGCGGKAAGAQYYSGIAGKSKASLFTKRQSIGGFVVLFTVCQRTNFFSETYSEAFLQFHVDSYGLRKSSGSSSSKSSYWSGE